MIHQDFINMKLKKILVVLVILFTQINLAQKKTRADRFFEKGDFTNAAKYYEENLVDIPHKKTVKNLSDCYYNTFKYRAASRYLKNLVKGKFLEKDKTYDNLYNFKLYQVLSALGDYETGLDYFKLYKDNLNIEIDKTKSIEVIEDFKLKNPDYVVKKTQFNTDAADFGAIKFSDTIYFSSDRDNNKFLGKTYKWTHQPFLDIYAVEVNENLDTIGKVKALPKGINSNLHEGNFCFSKDGNTIYISKSNTDGDKKVFNEKRSNNIHLYKSTKNNGVWGDLEKLSFCKNGFSYQHPSLSNDGSTLYLSSNKEGGFGSFDLYEISLNSLASGGGLINLGPTINTENREHFPFLSEDGHLFFSSNGHLGLGMLDVFVAENIAGKYSNPINLGAPINSRYDDFSLSYFNDTDGLFSSNRLKSDDIYSFKQVGEIFIREYVNTFEVRDFETKEFIKDVSVVFTGKNNEEIYVNTLDSIARFNLNLLPGSYHLKATNDKYVSGEMNVNVLEKQDQVHVLYLSKIPPPPPLPVLTPEEKVIIAKNIDVDLKVKDPKRFEMLTDTDGPPIVEKDGKLFFELEPIYFDFDMWNIRSDSKLVLIELAKKLERYPNIHLKISSHTDSRGTARYNQILSERRAESTRNFLALEVYINARRFTFAGYGEFKPIVSCPMLDCTEEEHQLNRRSEFEIIKY